MLEVCKAWTDEQVCDYLEGRRCQFCFPINFKRLRDPEVMSIAFENRRDVVATSKLGSWEIVSNKFLAADSVYVQEFFSQENAASPVLYRADGAHPEGVVWTSPKSMKSAQSRIHLHGLKHSAKRLLDFTLEDFEAEGFIPMAPSPLADRTFTYRVEFMRRWNKTNSKFQWRDNPWVFIVSFDKHRA